MYNYDKVKDLAHGMELCIYEYLGKAAEDEDPETKGLALSYLGFQLMSGWTDNPTSKN